MSIGSMASSDSDAVKLAIGNLLLRAETNEIAKRVISVFDPFASRAANIKSLNGFNLNMLEPCAEFLCINLADAEGNKLFTKESLVQRILLAFCALLPSVCLDCNECYTVDLDPEEQPLFHCHVCFRGSHNCSTIKNLHAAFTAASLSLLSGHVWLCSSCKKSSYPIKPRRSKSRHDNVNISEKALSRIDGEYTSQQDAGIHTPSQNAGNFPVPCLQSTGCQTPNPSVQFDDVQLNNQELRKKSNIVSEDRVCKRYKKGICPHGLKGNKIHDGKKCDYEHSKYCIKYCRNGNQQKLGCNKGANCNFFHPVLCKNSVKCKVCTNIECKFIHLKGTHRKKSESPRPRHKTGAQTSTEDENTAPEHFLQLQRLVETMRANFVNEIASIRSSLQPLLLQQPQFLYRPQQMAPITGTAVPQFLNQYHPHTLMSYKPASVPDFPPLSS